MCVAVQQRETGFVSSKDSFTVIEKHKYVADLRKLKKAKINQNVICNENEKRIYEVHQARQELLVS